MYVCVCVSVLPSQQQTINLLAYHRDDPNCKKEVGSNIGKNIKSDIVKLLNACIP